MGNVESLHMKEVTGSERENLQKRASMRGPIPPTSTTSGTFKSSPLFQSNGNNNNNQGGERGRGMNGVHRISEEDEEEEESQRNSSEMVSSRRGSFEFDLSGGTPVSTPVTPENRKK